VPFASAHAGHPAYRLSPDETLVLVAHQIEALEVERKIVRLQTLLGGKSPHPQSFLVGGMSLAPPWDGPVRSTAGEHPQQPERDYPGALSPHGLADIEALLRDIRAFVDEVAIEESAAHSWYVYEGDPAASLRPAEGQTNPRYTGPPPPVATLSDRDRYTWVKAPRYGGEPMEAGPLARLAVAYAAQRWEAVTRIEETAAHLGIGVDRFFSTLGRMTARALEAQILTTQLDAWREALEENFANGDRAIADISRWDPGAWPATAAGFSLGEAPAGALGHWVETAGQQVADYQLVDGSTWNASPRDAAGRRGPVEEALIGTRVHDPARPLEVLRTVHAFDVCAACAVHAVTPGAAAAAGVAAAGLVRMRDGKGGSQ
jgi:Ni,Fe-hydrogenase I large subunit